MNVTSDRDLSDIMELEFLWLLIQCFRSCDQLPYLHTKMKGKLFIKIELNSQKNLSLLQHGRSGCFFVSRLQHGCWLLLAAPTCENP